MAKPIKVYLADNSNYRTTTQLINFLTDNPDFELRKDPYWNPLLAEWADVIWVEWAETAAQLASKRGGKGGTDEFKDIRINHILQPDKEKYDWTGKKLIVRAIDIDVYYGHYRSIKWENIDCLAYSAKHIFKRMDDEMHFADNYPNLKVFHMPFSINVDDWTFKKRDGSRHNIAWINHNWSAKGLPLMLQAFKLLQVAPWDWKLHIVCDWSSEAWFKPYIEHIVKELDLVDDVIFYGKVPSVDKFLDDMDYLVSSSYKETFSLPIAEASAKGIKCLTHNWEGAKDVWPEEMVWTTVEEFAEKILDGEYDSEKYRELAKKYGKQTEIDNFLKIIK